MRQTNWVRIFFVAVFAALFTRCFLVESYRIDGDSMQPALADGDIAFVLKCAYSLRIPFSTYELLKIHRPERGDVAVFSLPEMGFQTMVKRVIAIAGDRVQIDKGQVWINGVPEAIHYPLQWENRNAEKYGPVELPPNYFFALGDNRQVSSDSRVWGPIPYSCLKGRLLFKGAVRWLR